MRNIRQVHKYILVFILIFLLNFCNAQDKTNKQKLIDDFNIYLQFLEQTHPDPYSAYNGRIEFHRSAQKTRDMISESTTIEQFRGILSKFISKLGDGHTTISPQHNNEEDKNISPKLLPILLKISTDGIFINNATQEFSKYIGSSILSINNQSIDILLSSVEKIRPSENIYGAYLKLVQLLSNNNDAKTLLGDNILGLLLEIKSTTGQILTINIPYVEKQEWLKTSSKIKLREDNKLLNWQIIGENNNVGYFIWNGVYSREMVEDVVARSPKYLDMNLNSIYKYSMKTSRPKDDSIAIKGIPSLYENFSRLLYSMKSQKSNYLIIDLRNNSGGMAPLCNPLLYMLYGDMYLEYDCEAEYNRILSPLLLKKWNVKSIEEYNNGNNTNYILGDYLFSNFLHHNDKRPVEEKRKDYSYVLYFNRIGLEYVKDLDGKPIHNPHVIVLTSPKTFSAAYQFMYLLNQIGNATVIGVPSSQAGNTFMETTNFELPNTKISGSISNSIQILFPNDDKKGKMYAPNFSMDWIDYLHYDFDDNAEILFVLDLIKEGKIKIQ